MRPLTAAEWLSENSERQELAVMNIPLAMEAYAKYVASFVPKDVVEAIEKKYPVRYALCQNTDGSPSKMDTNKVERTAALRGYSLAAGGSVRFAEWLTYSAQPKSISKQWWILNADRKEYTTEQLFEIFKKESNG